VRRREFITLLGCGAAAWQTSLHAQQAKTPIIGFVSSGSRKNMDNLLAAFHDGLRDQGFVEGKNIAVEYRWANGNYDQLSALAAELVNLGVAVILASGGSTTPVAAKKVTSTIPIVFTAVPDPVELGLVASLNRPASNLTGASILTSELLPKRFELLSALVPKADVFGLLVNSNLQISRDEIKFARVAAAAHGKTVVPLIANFEPDFEPAFDKFVAQNCDALILSVAAVFNNFRDTLIALADRHRIPTMYGWPEFPHAGGLASYGSNLSEDYRLSGIYVGRILKGEKPQDLPVIQPTKFNFVLNLKTMKALNIEAPANILALADEVIE
jgi:putative tryptophan/tyrosine transport system substrate-binding protein